MEQSLALILRYARAAWRRRWLGMIVAWAFCALGWVAVQKLPDQYQVSARIYVDTDAVLTPLLKGLAVDVKPSDQVSVLQQTLLSTPNLQTLISKTDLGLSATTDQQRQALMATLAQKIAVTPDPLEKNLFSITYTSANPRLARDVVQGLLAIFTENATATNRRDMENAQQFLRRQVASYQQQLHAMEEQRAAFRSKYVGILPLDGDPRGGLGLDTARANLAKAEIALQEELGKDAVIKAELARAFPHGLDPNASRPQIAGNGMTPLQQAESVLSQMETIYTDSYPGVVAQKRLVARLRAAQAATSKAAGTFGAGSPELFAQLTMKQLDTESNIATMKHQVELAKTDVKRIETIQAQQPALMAQYQNMDRDYAVLKKNFDELLARLHSASLSQAADTQADKVHLRIIDPPQIPLVPVGPPRLILLSAVFVLGIGLGVGVAVLLALLDQSFDSADDLQTLGVPVLGSISAVGARLRRRRALSAAQFAVGVLLLVAAYGELVVRTATAMV